MKTIDVTQGSAEWLAARAQHFCASEAPAMMGASKHMSRTELLKLKKLGLEAEVGRFKQDLFDRGHAAEESIRPHVENLIGTDLYPVVGVRGNWLASFDGLSMDELTIFEHKIWNADLAEQVRRGELDPHYYWQLEHEACVAEAAQVIFVVSDGTPENFAMMEYTPRPDRQAKLRAGWAQFAIDLEAYEYVEVLPAAVAAPIEPLPAVSVKMEGNIAVISNLDVFGERLKAYVEGIDKMPSTDQGFADAEAAVKALKTAEDMLAQAETAALSQTSSIADMLKTVQHYSDIARTTRLLLDKMVKTRKDTLRVEIQQEHAKLFADHIAVINKRLGRITMPAIATDFAGVMKGKKTISSVRSAASDELARAKIEANAVAELISANLASLNELASDHKFLFSDAQQIITKSNDDLVLLIKARITEHTAAEQKRLDDEREKIRAEEERKAREKIDRENQAEQERIALESKPAPAAVQAVVSADTGASRQPVGRPASQQASSAPQKLINLGAINALLSPITLSSEGLAQLGFQPAKVDRASKLYDEAQLPAIYAAIVRKVQSLLDAAT